ncbi:unnamed protein product, partial [Nesidiocoris tenuis]
MNNIFKNYFYFSRTTTTCLARKTYGRTTSGPLDGCAMRVRREAEGEGSGRCEREDAGAARWSEREGKVRVRGEQYRAQRAGNGSGEQAAAGARRTARAVWPATREESTN